MSNKSEIVGVWTSALLACYAGAWLLVSPLAGSLTDYFLSRRTTFVIAILALGGATVLLCVGSSIGMFVLGRILQGVSSAFTWTAGITLAVETVETHEVGKTLGICSLGMNLALLLAPILGGLLLEQLGYYSVYAVAFILAFLDMIWRLVLIERGLAAPWLEQETHKYWTMVFGENGTPNIIPSPISTDIPDLEPLLFENETLMNDKADDQVKRHGCWEEVTQTMSAGWRLLGDSRLQVALWATFAQITLITSLDAVLPLFVQDTFSWGAQGAGLIFIPVALPTFMAPYIGSITDKHGPKWMVGSAFLLQCPVWILMRLVTHTGVSQIILLCALLALLGTTTTFATSPLMAEITFAIESQNRIRSTAFGSRGAIAQAYALYSLSLASGLLVGPLWGGLVDKFAGWKTMTLTLGLLSGITVAPTIYLTGGPVKLAKIF